MARDFSSSFTVLLIQPDARQRDQFATSIRKERSLRLLASAETLNQAYQKTEMEHPDLVIVSDAQLHLPEFPMYAAVLEMLQIDCLVLTEGRRITGQFANLPQIAKAKLEDGNGLGPFLVRRNGLKPSDSLRAATTRKTHVARPTSRADDGPANWKTVVIGCSTGGIEALMEILRHFPKSCPPTLVVQHIGAEYVQGLAHRLDRHCPAQVTVATATSQVRQGTVLLAPGGTHHLAIAPPGKRCRLLGTAPVSGHRPSVDVLFDSASKLGANVVGVLLTGMGRDGAEGLRAIRAAGGMTLAQDKASSVVYGMPRAAVELGAACQQYSLARMGPAILKVAKLKDVVHARP